MGLVVFNNLKWSIISSIDNRNTFMSVEEQINEPYVVIRQAWLSKLTDTVNHLMEKGYVPQGGIAVDDDGMLMQAMVLKK